MDKDGSKGPGEQALFAEEAWFDPIEASLRGRIRGLIEEMVEQELEAALGRGRYEPARPPAIVTGTAGGSWPARLGRSSWPFPAPACTPRMVPPGNGAAPCCRGMRGGRASSRR